MRFPKNSESGISLVECILAIGATLAVIALLRDRFLLGRSSLAHEQARLAYETDMIRIGQASEESSTCETLSFVKAGYSLAAPGQVLADLTSLRIGKVELASVGKQTHYMIRSIRLIQESPTFGQLPSRAIGKIEVNVDFLDAKGQVIPGIPEQKKKRLVYLALVSDASGQIIGCYGRFSRRLACESANGVYDPEASPNCKI